MIGRYQVTPNDIGRLTSQDTLTMLQANIDKLPNGMFWYEATSGATSLYTNREVQRNATIAVWIRGESRCAVMFPFGTQVPYIMYRYGSGTEWTGFYKYGSESFASLGDLQTVNNTINSINTQITDIEGDVSGLATQVQTNTQNIANNTTEISSLDGRVDALETTVGNHTTEISTLDGRADSLETTVGNQATEISTLDGRADSLETTTANHTQELNSMDSRVDVIEEVIDPDRMGYAQYSFTPQNGGLNELFPAGPVISNQLEVTRVVVVMSAQICNFSMTVQLKNSLPVGATMYTPSMDSNGFYTSQADNGKIFLGKNRSASGSYPTFELLTYNTILRNTTSASIATGSNIETSWTMVVAPTFKSLATRWAAYRMQPPV